MGYHRQLTGNDEPYKLQSILEEEPPPGTEGIDWHCYVITQGTNTITGHRRGGLESVTLAVEEIVVQLNERRRLKTGRVHLVMSANRKSVPPAR